MRMVIDYDSDNECDICGVVIPAGEIYYASVDDVEVLCAKHSYIADLSSEEES